MVIRTGLLNKCNIEHISPADSGKTVHFVIKASNLAHIYIILVYENLDIVPSPISRLGAWQLFSYVIPISRKQ